MQEIPNDLTPTPTEQLAMDRRRRGFILITHTLMCAVTIAFVGLAVDAGTLYVIKGRLSSAVDAAALAAGRSVNLAQDITTAQTNATATAQQFFNANFPNGYLGTGQVNVSVPAFVDEKDPNGNPTGILDIAVSASVPAPTYFIRIFNAIPFMTAPNTVTVGATGTATRRGTVMILVLDISSSMVGNLDANGRTACDEMKFQTQQFIKNFSPYDTIGAVTFDYTARLLYPPDHNFLVNNALSNALGTISCNNNTNTTSGLYLGYEAIKSVGLPLAYNSIVLFTDGSPNGISADFPVYTAANRDIRYLPNPPTTLPTGCTLPLNALSALCNTLAPQTGCAAGTTIRGTFVQGQGQATSGSVGGPQVPIGPSSPLYSGDATPSNCGGAQATALIAYIPDTDLYGNSTHGVPATSGLGTLNTVQTVSPSCTGVNASGATTTTTCDTRDFWVFPGNNLCASPSGTSVAPCAALQVTNQQWGGGPWASTPIIASEGGTGTGSNFFTTGPNRGFYRPDQPTTIVAASMNTAMEEAYFIRADASGCPGPFAYHSNGTLCATKYNPVINTIYLTGNKTDAVDHEFLPIMSNVQTITGLPYDATFTNYANPAYVTNQQTGLYQVTADATQLGNLFSKLASETLRLSK